MSRDWDATFSNWGAPPGSTQQAKCENAERAVRKAIEASRTLNGKPIRVFTQGSYANRTNVREDSDVDICVLYTGAFFPDFSLSDGLSSEILGHGTESYAYTDFKNDVEAALVSYFGCDHVVRGDKAFDVHANAYRTDADVVPCFEHRRFLGNIENHSEDHGTEFHPDNGGIIINWPEQNYDNGTDKNDATGRRFKALTRILKRLRYEMLDQEYQVAEPIASFLIECLAWNVPNEHFGHTMLRTDVRESIAYLWRQTRSDETCNDWGEINDRKYLFRGQPTWNRQQVNSFLHAAWNYIGFQS